MKGLGVVYITRSPPLITSVLVVVATPQFRGLLRQYFPQRTDQSQHRREDLDAVAAELDSRPRKTLDWETPAERLANLLATAS
ncbi:hypothetical protein GCM10022420_012190 [Streptomyces iranensis]|uniref:Transposase, IS30 family protein n=1 Tax=Streptomyces iranensis TaxID=576784 RepID=A0A060ZVC1_9ACTN|nr:hypothetical protein [Streptomyces iranensis]CDR10085.1 transposase, IS30 family protein [Streptomyces iranensis]